MLLCRCYYWGLITSVTQAKFMTASLVIKTFVKTRLMLKLEAEVEGLTSQNAFPTLCNTGTLFSLDCIAPCF